MATLQTARDRAKAQVRTEILATARAHLAVSGPADLSLRAVARDLGLVPSAVYRYFEHRDALITALIVTAYEALGDAVDAAINAAARRRPAARWLEAARAVRQWAFEQPHEYALLYGTPVPGYAAPATTVDPGTRVPLALLAIVADAHAAGQLSRTASATPSPTVRRELEALVSSIGVNLPAEAAFDTILAWTQLFGLVGFELFHQTRGMVTDHAALFDDAATTMAHHIGL